MRTALFAGLIAATFAFPKAGQSIKSTSTDVLGLAEKTFDFADKKKAPKCRKPEDDADAADSGEGRRLKWGEKSSWTKLTKEESAEAKDAWSAWYATLPLCEEKEEKSTETKLASKEQRYKNAQATIAKMKERYKSKKNGKKSGYSSKTSRTSKSSTSAKKTARSKANRWSSIFGRK
jgi:hypothetical protein